MGTISVKRSITVTTILGLFISCEGQPMMRKRVVVPVIKIEDLEPFSNGNERSPDYDVKDNIREHVNERIDSSVVKLKEVNYMNKLFRSQSDKKIEKVDRKLVDINIHSKSKKSEGIWIEDYFSNMVRMNGIPMSMPSSPVATPTEKPIDTIDDDNASKKPVVAPTPSPTLKQVNQLPVPVITPTQGSGCESLSREEVLKETLGKVTGSSILNDFSTPQGKAFRWILDRDVAQIDPCTFVTIEQRYALATFFYSTSGDGWDNSDGWLTDPFECSWIGIKCNENGLVEELGANGALIANDLSGVMPQEIKVFEALEVIQVGQNTIGGSIPDILTELPQLRLFDVEINSLSGPAIVNLEGLDQLESYRVSANRFSGSIDPAIGSVGSLRELWMADNQITGTIPESFGNLVNIETLYIYRNNLVGILPSTFGQLRNLRELQVFQNSLSGTIPEGLYSNTEIGLMRLDRNQFTGTISESIGNLVKLEDLRIDENLFTGKLPASFMNLSGLVVLRVNDNNFVGSIRDGFDIWKSLDFADFRNNGFDGTLPETIFGIPSIRILYFANNNLDGTLPPNYGNSPVLRDLFLSGNQLSGTIPDIQVGQLTMLTELLLEDNKFTGGMAESICNLRTAGQGMLEDLWVDCGQDANPRLECDAPGCCTACFPSTP